MISGPDNCHFETVREDIDRAIAAHLPSGCPEAELLEAARYAVAGPAKRVRSMLLVLASDALGGDRTGALAAGCAVEFTHAASLILDDLPSMDDAGERRGKPATHIAFSEATAVLGAIALLNEAYAVLAQADGIPEEARAGGVTYLARAVGFHGLVAGQMTDLKPQNSADLAHVEAKHFGKTGALFAASLALAGVVAGATQDKCEALWQAGGRLGVAFQGYDDLLDRYAAASSVGKPVGADESKQTVATLLGREAALEWCNSRLAEANDKLSSVDLGDTSLSRYVEGLSIRLTAPLLESSG